MKKQKTFTAQEAAAELDMGYMTITRLCKAGKISHQKIGGQYRFTRENLDEYIDQNTVQIKPGTGE